MVRLRDVLDGASPYKTQQVETAVALLRTLGACKDGLILVELALFDGKIYPDDVLPDDAASTNVEMADEDQDE